MANATETVVERELVIAAKPETVWELLVDPEKASAWMGMQSWSEPTPGGLYRVEVIPGNIARGEYVELDPPNRLVFTWGWEAEGNPVPAGSSTVTFELEVGRRRHTPAVRAQRPSVRRGGRVARARLGSLLRAARRSPRGAATPGPIRGSAGTCRRS